MCIGTFQTTAQGVGQHLVGQALGKSDRIGFEDCSELFIALERSAIGERACGLYREVAVLVAPGADGVEVL